MRYLALALVAGCYRGGAPVEEPTVANKSAAPAESTLSVTAHGVGPIDADTKATLLDLRALLPSYEVRPVNDGALQYDIYKGTDRIGFVVPDEATGLVFNIHVTSSKVRVVGHPWRVGRVFGDSRHLTNCECWGPNPTCYAAGEHIAVNFARVCDEVVSEDKESLRLLDGLTVQRVIWSPTPFGESYGETQD